MKNEFINYEQALALKELGFDEECIASYDNEGDFKDPFEYNSEETDGYVTNSSLKDPKNFNASSNLALLKDYLDNPFTAAPLYQQAFRWFREKHNLYSEINLDSYKEPYSLKVTIKHLDNILYQQKCYSNGIGDIDNKKYEEAELACLDVLIKIVKNGK
jgi:hypothetical protein